MHCSAFRGAAIRDMDDFRAAGERADKESHQKHSRVGRSDP